MPYPTLIERLELYSEYITETGCRIWTGEISTVGDYGLIKIHGKTTRVHRVAWEVVHGPIPNNLWVLHKCDIRICINVNHLYLGTHQDNINDMMRKKRHRTLKGEDGWNAVLTVEKVMAIRGSTEYNTVLAKQYNVSRATISAIKLHKRWRHVT